MNREQMTNLIQFSRSITDEEFAFICRVPAEEAREYMLDWALRDIGWRTVVEDSRGLGVVWVAPQQLSGRAALLGVS